MNIVLDKKVIDELLSKKLNEHTIRKQLSDYVLVQHQLQSKKSGQIEAEVKPACVPQERFGIYVSAINKIDDFFEYRYKAYTPEEIKKVIMKYVDNIAEQLSKSV